MAVYIAVSFDNCAHARHVHRDVKLVPSSSSLSLSFLFSLAITLHPAEHVDRRTRTIGAINKYNITRGGWMSKNHATRETAYPADVVSIETSSDRRWITRAAPKTGVITRQTSICTRAMRAA